MDPPAQTLIVWNYRRCRSDPTICNLKSLLRTTSPMITFISESHSNPIQSTSIIKELNVANPLHSSINWPLRGLMALMGIHNLLITSSTPNFIMVEIQIVMVYWNGILSACMENTPFRREKSSEKASLVLSRTYPSLYYVLVILMLYHHNLNNTVVNQFLGVELRILIIFLVHVDSLF